MCRLSFVICLLSAWLVPSFASAQRIVAETFMIPASDPGIQLHVRNKRLEGRDSFSAERIVLFVHGATYPSETGFDINLPGGSWVEYVARSGYDVYFVDVRGYGRSTRPAAMDAPATENPPFATTVDAVKDVGSAVDFILKRRNISKLNLIGWSWGTAIMAGYTMNNNDRVNKLVLYQFGISRRHHRSAGPARIARLHVMRRASGALAESRRSGSRKLARARGLTHGGRATLRQILQERNRIHRCCVRPMGC